MPFVFHSDAVLRCVNDAIVTNLQVPYFINFVLLFYLCRLVLLLCPVIIALNEATHNVVDEQQMASGNRRLTDNYDRMLDKYMR